MKPIKDQIKKLPDSPGVYFFLDKRKKIIYVGKAISLRKRARSYFSRSTDSIKTDFLVSDIAGIKFKKTATELAALILESQMIKKLQPRYNIDLRDDKAYPCLTLTVSEDWPRLIIARRKKDDGNLYFGPYRAATAREFLRLIKRFFTLRWCKSSPLKSRKQPCLQFHIGRCLGPCVGKISKRQYTNIVKGVADFLNGKVDRALSKLQKEMQTASEEMNFERAAKLRDKIKELERFIAEGSAIKEYAPKDQNGNLEALKKELNLSVLPKRIEAFDISNLGASSVVGAMAAFVGGLPHKNHYRKFKIKTFTGQDDTGAIHEVVKRRYSGVLAKSLPMPDLILVDGGIPQVNSAQKALKEIGVDLPLISLAKKNEEIFFPDKNQPLALPKTSKSLQLLQRIRDEVHRFVITYHRKKRRQAFLGS